MIIAIGNSRKDKTFKIVDISWEQFLNKVSNTVRTVETIEEYEKMKKSIKDDIKDVGGFVGGKLKDGRRRKDSVEFRSMLTLDLDYAENNLWEKVTKLFNFACCIYSTHKHKKDKHRLRLIIPLRICLRFMVCLPLMSPDLPKGAVWPSRWLRFKRNAPQPGLHS